jgi:hypothetical protein
MRLDSSVVRPTDITHVLTRKWCGFGSHVGWSLQAARALPEQHVLLRLRQDRHVSPALRICVIVVSIVVIITIIIIIIITESCPEDASPVHAGG